MANTIILINTPDTTGLTLIRLTAVGAGQPQPNASGYAPVSTSNGWEYQITASEALVGFYRLQVENGAGATVAQGFVNIEADDAGPYVADESLSVIRTEARIKTLLQNAIDIQAKTDLIGSGSATLSQPVSSAGQIVSPIIIGDDYLAALGRAFEWTVDPLPGVVVGDASCKFGGSNGDDSWLITGTVSEVTVNSETKWKLSFDMTKAVSGDLGAGVYDWSVELLDGSNNEVTRVRNANNDYRAVAVDKQT